MFRDWSVARTFNASAWITNIVWALLAFAYFGVQGVLLNLYLLRLGFGLEFIGLLNGAGQLAWAVAALPAGALGRRIGLRPALILANSLLALGITLFLLVEFLPRPLWPACLFATWIVVWLGAAMIAVNNTSYTMQVTTPAQRNYAFTAQTGLIVIFGFAGSLLAGRLPGWIAASIGASLDQPTPYRLAMILVPVAYALGIPLWLRAEAVPPPKQVGPSGSAARPLGLFVFFALVSVLQASGEGSVRAFFNVYLDKGLGLPLEQIGTIFGVGQLVPLAAVIATPALMRRWGSGVSFAIAALGCGLSLLPVAAFAHWAPATLGFVGILTMGAITSTARTVFSQEMVSEQWRSVTAGLSIIGLALGWSLTAAAGGYIIRAAGYRGLFFFSAGLAFTAAALLFGYLRSTRHKPVIDAEASA